MFPLSPDAETGGLLQLLLNFLALLIVDDLATLAFLHALHGVVVQGAIAGLVEELFAQPGFLSI